MNRRWLILFGAWLIVVTAICWSIYERNIAVAARQAIQAIDAERQVATRECQAAELRARRMNADAEAAERQLTAPRGTSSEGYVATPPPRDISASELLRARGPAEQARFALQNLAAYRRLGLTREQADRATAAFGQYQEHMSDLYRAASTQHLSTASPEFKALADQAKAELRKDVTDLVGADAWDTIEKYGDYRTAVAIQGIAADVCFGAEPLTLQQTEELRTAISSLADQELAWSASAPFRRNGATLMNLPIEQLETALQGAASFRLAVLPHLTPAQRAVVENRLLGAELDLKVAANTYSTWRTVRKSGAAAPSK